MFGLFKKEYSLNEEEFKAKMAAGGQVIDVRSPGEFRSGHLEKAKNIPLDQLSGKVSEISAMSSKGKDILLYCHSGSRSSMAYRILKNANIENIFDLKGGMMFWRGPVKR